MADKEARARVKINQLLREAGWRLLDEDGLKANVVLENHVKITRHQINDLGEDFEKTSGGFIDFLLLDDRGHPLVVLEAKKESLNPLVGKEQARCYARSQSCRFVLLSNGNLHYFWDLERGNPHLITRFPSPESVEGYQQMVPDRQKLVSEFIEADYVAQTQFPGYSRDPEYLNPGTRDTFIQKRGIRFLRPYQVRAVKALQQSARDGNDRYLFEMATGTGKTLVAGAIIKMFLRTGNAHRVLFLVDRIELENQALKAFTSYLKNDYQTVIYKENRDDWRRAEVVVTTVQSLLFDNKFRRLFSPTDFDLVISDEAHRSIGGNSRAVFEYFVGYKLGLTATPKDYLKKYDAGGQARDPRDLERRMLLDTYRTFGCESGQPTFRYSLIDGVKDGYLVNPTVVDARTDITTQLLSDEGYAVLLFNEEGEEEEGKFFQRDFEKKFFSEKTNRVFCRAFIENALLDPVSGEIGKTIIFTVSQNHAAKIAQVLNELADQVYPGKYNSDFAMQVTSFVPGAQQKTINFANNNLGGSGHFNPGYRSSKTRVCVTVGMMTTGYDCEDILNLCLMRPIFSPTDFIQIKGRGTRRFSFSRIITDPRLKDDHRGTEKKTFKLFDFFANCEYFEEKYDYDEILKLPAITKEPGGNGPQPPKPVKEYETFDPDKIRELQEQLIGLQGMKIDRMFFEQFESRVREDEHVADNVRQGNWDVVLDYIQKNILNKPEEFYTLEKLRRAANVDRRLTLREIIEKVFGLIAGFKSKDVLLEEEFAKFVSDMKPENVDDLIALKYFFKAYATDHTVREIIENKRFGDLNVNPTFTMQDYKAVPRPWREVIPEYIKDYVPINQFM